MAKKLMLDCFIGWLIAVSAQASHFGKSWPIGWVAKPARMAAAIASYCFCSASLLVINKVAVHKVLSLRAHPALPRSQA